MLSKPTLNKDLTKFKFKFNNLGLALSMALRFCGKRIKIRKVLGVISSVSRNYRGKTGRGTFLPSPPLSWIGLTWVT